MVGIKYYNFIGIPDASGKLMKALLAAGLCTMNNRKPKFLSGSEEIIMLAVQNHPRYGVQIQEILSEVSQGEVQILNGSLYPTLRKLEKFGLIEKISIQSRSSEARNRHSRHYYQTTPEGNQWLEDSQRMRAEVKRISDSYGTA